jgi:hypothetical protein
MIDIYDQKQFAEYYHKRKYEGKLDREIANEMYLTIQWFTVLKQLYDIETITIRRNDVGVTEEHFRKGALIGLDRRLILRRVRDGMSVHKAITTPRQKNWRNKND